MIIGPNSGKMKSQKPRYNAYPLHYYWWVAVHLMPTDKHSTQHSETSDHVAQFTIIFCKVFSMLFNYLKQKLFLLCVFGDCFIEMLYQRYSPFCRVIDANQILYKHCCNLERRSI
ncbi:hypothetical protein HELRODRAFT_178010 [Helobdella robusta]|uniref:Uncharacterized protein n=1 Tax=Helobdella robusta TaxID=6412 RepID=T1FCL6_HELRO|nr:hypothetical protein HELRODRAFT_178010 [Helobdella robusta]ESN97575.1 hypothetical protein HELRODRAFT_178010 [Helobdella robusta]